MFNRVVELFLFDILVAILKIEEFQIDLIMPKILDMILWLGILL